MLLGMISKLYKTQGINTIKAITTGNKTVQQNLNTRAILGPYLVVAVAWRSSNILLLLGLYLV